ncbi:hypothetical protein MRX96_010317 [Rhipicephalus microplus]
MRSIVAAIIVRNRQRTLYTVYVGDDRIHGRSFGADRFLGSRAMRVTGSGGKGSLFVFRLAASSTGIFLFRTDYGVSTRPVAAVGGNVGEPAVVRMFLERWQ